jgi:hypothetical protein
MFCNDPEISNFNDCLGEFVPLNGAYLLAPRVVHRPYCSFDTFGQSFYTLFLIVSQEGWTDVMSWARGVSSDSSNLGASNSTSNMNALFFILFNFRGTIFVTALFASVMIQNYNEATGASYLTRSQRAWAEQKRLLQRVHSSRRPAEPENLKPWRRWCYDLATRKEGRWQKFIVATFVVYLLLRCVDLYPSIDRWELIQGKFKSHYYVGFPSLIGHNRRRIHGYHAGVSPQYYDMNLRTIITHFLQATLGWPQPRSRIFWINYFPHPLMLPS